MFVEKKYPIQVLLEDTEDIDNLFMGSMKFNNANENDAAADSAKFGALLGQPVKPGNSSIFVGTMIEMMKNPGRGTHGHICVQTNYLSRAIYHLEKRGFAFDESSFKYDDKGNLKVAYMKDEIAGFAIHFNNK